MSFSNMKTMVGQKFHLINNEGDVLSIFHIEIASLPTQSEAGMINYVDNETGAKDQIKFRVSADNKSLNAWSALARESESQMFKIASIESAQGEFIGMEIAFDAQNKASFVIKAEEPTYYPSEEVAGVSLTQVAF